MSSTESAPPSAHEIAARVRRERQSWARPGQVVWLTPDGKPPLPPPIGTPHGKQG